MEGARESATSSKHASGQEEEAAEEEEEDAWVATEDPQLDASHLLQTGAPLDVDVVKG